MTKLEMANAIIDAANISDSKKERLTVIRSRLLSKTKEILTRHFDYVDSHKNREGAAIYSIHVATGIQIYK